MDSNMKARRTYLLRLVFVIYVAVLNQKWITILVIIGIMNSVD